MGEVQKNVYELAQERLHIIFNLKSATYRV